MASFVRCAYAQQWHFLFRLKIWSIIEWVKYYVCAVASLRFTLHEVRCLCENSTKTKWFQVPQSLTITLARLINSTPSTASDFVSSVKFIFLFCRDDGSCPPTQLSTSQFIHSFSFFLLLLLFGSALFRSGRNEKLIVDNEIAAWRRPSYMLCCDSVRTKRKQKWLR